MAKWAVVEDNKITEYYDILPSSWRNVSGLNLMENQPEQLLALGWYRVERNNISFDNSTQFHRSYVYEIKGDHVLETPILEFFESEQFTREEKFEKFMTLVREKRNSLLSASDWTQLADVQNIIDPVDIARWQAYREQLRDFTNMFTVDNFDIFKFQDIIWPDKNNVEIGKIMKRKIDRNMQNEINGITPLPFSEKDSG